jgi:hypothetical protein
MTQTSGASRRGKADAYLKLVGCLKIESVEIAPEQFRHALNRYAPWRTSELVMPGLVPGIHVLPIAPQERRGWPGQARP